MENALQKKDASIARSILEEPCVGRENHGGLYLQGEYFRCPPTIILIFGYVIEDRKIRNTCFFIFPRFHIWGVKTEVKVRVEKSFLWNI